MNFLYKKILKKIYSLIENTIFKFVPFFTRKNTLLLLRLDSIGDYILFRNFIEILRTSNKYKNYKITLCGNNWWKDIAESLDGSYIDQFIWVDFSKMSNDDYRFNLHKKIYFSGFEVVIHPTYSRDVVSDGVVRYSGAKEKIGYEGDSINLSLLQKEKNNLFYTTLIPSKTRFEFEFYRNRDFFEQLLDQKMTLIKPKISYSAHAESKIIIFPGAKDSFRRWATKNFAQLCSLLKVESPKAEFLICGSMQDAPLAKEIMNHTTVPFTDLTGKLSLIQLVDVLIQAKLIIANDSGPFHIAVALNKKVICISNGNNYGRFTPYPQEMNTQSVVVYPPYINTFSDQERLEKFGKEVKDVDINEITVEQVYSQIKKWNSVDA